MGDRAILRGFDGEGKWEAKPKRVQLSEITRIRFGTRYLELYQKYADCPPPSGVSSGSVLTIDT